MGLGTWIGQSMARGGRGGVVWAVMALWLLEGGLGVARGQAVKGTIVSVGIGGMPDMGQGGMFREACWVPVQVRLRNMTGQPFVGHLAVDQDLVDLDGDKVMSVGPEFTLAPGPEEHTLWAYYWPRPDFTPDAAGISKVVVLDKDGTVVPGGTLSTPGGRAQATRIAPVDRYTRDHSTRFVVVLGTTSAGWNNFDEIIGGTEGAKKMQVGSASQLPDNVLGFDGVDVVVWEADKVKVSDFGAPEFQLRALLTWVKAGGHLIISVGTQGQEFMKGPAELAAAMPLTITGTRDVKVSDLSRFWDVSRANTTWGSSLRFQGAGATETTLVQTIGEPKPGARAAIAEAPGNGAVFAEHPLVATGLCGQGAITVVTMDIAGAEWQQMSGKEWVAFWNQVAGWRQNGRQPFITRAEFDKMTDQAKESVYGSPLVMRLGKDIDADVDVTEETLVRILVTLMFLAVYWMLAGPVGHLVLHRYKVVHWSWWVFGGTVVTATAVAGAVVLTMHVKGYDVRHQSFVVGTVNDPNATVFSIYGIYASASGQVPIAQPATGGLNYVAPLDLPLEQGVRAYADPQSYQLHTDQAGVVSPVFRNTLKKLQGRWNGALPGIAGNAAYLSNATGLEHVVSGSLTNDSGYDLEDAVVMVYLPPATPAAEREAARDGSTYLYHLGPAGSAWKRGASVDLAKATLDELEWHTLVAAGNPFVGRVGTVEMALEAIGWNLAPYSEAGGGLARVRNQPTMITDPQMMQLIRLQNRNPKLPTYLMYFLGDARNLDPLDVADRRELARGIGRWTDCTKTLRAAGALIVAKAENVRSPVTLQVNERAVAGKGTIYFAWALPVAGVPPKVSGLATPTGGAGGPNRGGGLVPELEGP
jgi:hypothetical protein